jgi:uncharacterized protein (TIGR03086 family)
MTEMTDPRPLHARALTQTATIINQVRPGQLAGPTPCSEYDVRKLLSHMVGAVNRLACMGEGGDALALAPFVDDVPDDGWPRAFGPASARAQTAWADDVKLDELVAVPWGKVPGRAALAGYIQEILVHGWDLATATGPPVELDPELAEFALAFAHRALPPEPRGTAEIPFGPVVPAPPGAGPYTQLATYLGRTP